MISVFKLNMKHGVVFILFSLLIAFEAFSFDAKTALYFASYAGMPIYITKAELPLSLDLKKIL